MRLPRWFHLLGSPPYVYRLAERLCRGSAGSVVTLLTVGAFWGLVIAPPDYQQGESTRIIYIHPQTAYIRMMAYVVMAVGAGIGYVWRVKLAHAVAVSAAPIGAWFTFCALFTGAVWGRPTGELTGSGAIHASCSRHCCCSYSWAISRCAALSTIAIRRIA